MPQYPTSPDTPTAPSWTPRVEYALALMRDGEMRPEEIKARIMATFGVCRSVASEDLRRANLRIQDAIDEIAPHVGGQIKTALMRIAKKAEDTGTVRGLDVASSTLARLGKLCGVDERSDPAKAVALHRCGVGRGDRGAHGAARGRDGR